MPDKSVGYELKAGPQAVARWAMGGSRVAVAERFGPPWQLAMRAKRSGKPLPAHDASWPSSSIDPIVLFRFGRSDAERRWWYALTGTDALYDLAIWLALTKRSPQRSPYTGFEQVGLGLGWLGHQRGSFSRRFTTAPPLIDLRPPGAARFNAASTSTHSRHSRCRRRYLMRP
jgi:hypothetical protein